MVPLKNWDNKTWLSSKKYIHSFNKFILTQTNLNKYSRILDIGCGRGKIIGNLSHKLELLNKPIGIDVENHSDKSKKITFQKIDALTFINKTKSTFDLIIIKQTIHLLKISEILKLLSICNNKLNSKGKIMILGLDHKKIYIPSFKLMDKKLKKSLKRDKKIFDIINKVYPKAKIKNFIFDVKILKKEYVKYIKKRYISTLINLSGKQIDEGICEINSKYNQKINFKDKLICLIIKN